MEVGDGYLRIAADHVLEDMLTGLGATVSGWTHPSSPRRGAYSGATDMSTAMTTLTITNTRTSAMRRSPVTRLRRIRRASTTSETTMAEKRPALRVGIGGPVGSGKTALTLALCREFRDRYEIAAVTNDIYTAEDAQFLVTHEALPPERILGVETAAARTRRFAKMRRSTWKPWRA